MRIGPPTSPTKMAKTCFFSQYYFILMFFLHSMSFECKECIISLLYCYIVFFSQLAILAIILCTLQKNLFFKFNSLLSFKRLRDYYFAPRMWCSIAISLSVYLWVSVCLFICISKKATRRNFTKFYVHVTCGCGLVFFRWQCNILWTSGFVDDVMGQPTLCLDEFAMWRHSRRPACYGSEVCCPWLFCSITNIWVIF